MSQTPDRGKPNLKYLFFALRPKQWIKNLFIFIPLIFGHKFFVYPANLRALFAFILFCMAASTIYLVNDIIDLERDRRHRTKRLRPLASGRISVGQAQAAAFLLFCAAVPLSLFLNFSFGLAVLLYCVLNIGYTFYLKNVVILDVFCIALFFLLRIVAGTVVAEVAFSHWMIFMIVLLAMFLSFNKRRQDLKFIEKAAAAAEEAPSRYTPYFIDQMISTLTSSIAVVYMLYTVDDRTIREVGSNHLIYSIPFVYYGIFRYLYLVHLRYRGEDPTAVVYSDRVMLLNIVLWALTCMLIIYCKL